MRIWGFFIMKTLYKAYIDHSSFSWGHFNSQEKPKTMLMQNFGMTNIEYYGMLWYFLEWSILVCVICLINIISENLASDLPNNKGGILIRKQKIRQLSMLFLTFLPASNLAVFNAMAASSLVPLTSKARASSTQITFSILVYKSHIQRCLARGDG